MKAKGGMSGESGEASPEPLWSMAAVSRSTGLSAHTLRAWERRFGFPKPVRLPSGHRRFNQAQVQRLALIARALEAGHRAGDVVGLPEAMLRGLLEGRPGAGRPPRFGEWKAEFWPRMLRYEREPVVQSLHQEAATLGLHEFLRARVAPLLDEIGDAWASGGLSVNHEHFITEVLEDVLRSLRIPLEAGAANPPVLLTTLPNEPHRLGLQMAALTIAASGRAVRLLGCQTPPEEIAAAARAMRPSAVALSVSVHSAGAETEAMVRALAASIPKEIGLWLGGAGAARLDSRPARATLIGGLDSLQSEVHALKTRPR